MLGLCRECLTKKGRRDLMIDLDLMEAVELASGPIEKIALLKEQPDSAKELFRLALDPTVTFGVTADVDYHLSFWRLPRTNRADDKTFWYKFVHLLHTLSARGVTGNQALEQINAQMKVAPSERHVIWACRILMKDLRCNVGVSTVNKVWPDLIDDLSVMLAQPYDPEKHTFDGEWCFEPKLDGYRMTIIDGVPYSRNKRVFTSVDHILKAFTDAELADNVFDGEIMGSGQFDEAGGSIRRKSKQATDAEYHVFDLIKRSQWTAPTDSLMRRRAGLEELFKGKENGPLRLVRQLRVFDASHDEAIIMMRKFIKEGYEGSVAKRRCSSYAYERGPDVIKIKDFVEEDLKIVDEWKEGKGKHKGKLGAIFVERNGVRTRVGSGFSDEQRKKIWASRAETVGRIAEISYQNLTPDGKLRFPVFLRFRPDKE